MINIDTKQLQKDTDTIGIFLRINFFPEFAASPKNKKTISSQLINKGLENIYLWIENLTPKYFSLNFSCYADYIVVKSKKCGVREVQIVDQTNTIFGSIFFSNSTREIVVLGEILSAILWEN